MEYSRPVEGNSTLRENFLCDCCSSRVSDFYCSSNGYDIVCCSECGHGQITPIPSQKELEEFYSSQTDVLDNSFGFRNLRDYLSHPGAAWRFNRQILKDLLKTVPDRNKTILEIGCSTGFNLALLRDFCGYTNLIGVDWNHHAVVAGKKALGLDIRHASVEHLESESFPHLDAVLALHVFEHLRHPSSVFRSIRSLLSPGGVLVINVPNFASFNAQWSKQDWKWLMPPGHIHYYTPHSLRLVLENSGYKIRIMYTAQNFFPGGYPADIIRLIRHFLGRNRELPSDIVPPFSYYNRYYFLLLLGDSLSRILTFPLWLFSRFFGRGACIICIAEAR